MAVRKATVQNAHGIHCRPSAEIVKAIKGVDCTISVSGNGQASDLRSVIGLVGMGLEPGAEVEISVEGGDAEKVADTLVELFERHYDFPPR